MGDHEGYIRVFSRGGIPLDAELVAYHRDRLDQRGRAEGRHVSFQMVTDDIYAISRRPACGKAEMRRGFSGNPAKINIDQGDGMICG